MQIRLASTLQPDSIVDGEGIRTVIWTQGCGHACPGCQNPETWDFKGGFLVDLEDVKKEMDKLEGQQGITLSGGDPLFQSEACTEIAKYAHKLGMDVWCYTGFNYEDLLKNKKTLELLKNIDVLVDGKFIIAERSLNLYFRGSRNQKIIDVPKSLKEGKAVVIEKYMKEKDQSMGPTKEQGIYI